jgi:hypothetical protein
LYYNDHVGDDRFNLDLLDDEDPFEIDAQAAHLLKHPRAWASRTSAMSGQPTRCFTPPNLPRIG